MAIRVGCLAGSLAVAVSLIALAAYSAHVASLVLELPWSYCAAAVALAAAWRWVYCNMIEGAAQEWDRQHSAGSRR